MSLVLNGICISKKRYLLLFLFLKLFKLFIFTASIVKYLFCSTSIKYIVLKTICSSEYLQSSNQLVNNPEMTRTLLTLAVIYNIW